MILNEAADIRLGETAVQAVYLGETRIWERGGGGGLPAGYTAVTCLKCRGGQYFDTGYIPTLATEIRMRCAYDVPATTEVMSIFDSTSGNYDIGADLYFARSGTGLIGGVCGFAFGETTYTRYLVSVAPGIAANYRFTAGALYVDDVLIGSNTPREVSGYTSIIVGRGSLGKSIDYYFWGDIYSFDIYENGALVHSFVPCQRDADGVTGFYDITAGGFFPSANEAFVLPNAGVPNTFRTVAYVENTTASAAYVNLQMTATASTEVEADCSFTDTTHDMCLYGVRGGSSSDNYCLWLSEYDSDMPSATFVMGDISYANVISRHKSDTGEKYPYTGVPRGQRAVYRTSSEGVFVDGVKTCESYLTGTVPTGNWYSMLLFNRSSGGSYGSGSYWYGKLYGFKLRESGGLVRDLVPCVRIADSVAGLYDRVTGQFFTPANSGTLVAGEEG